MVGKAAAAALLWPTVLVCRTLYAADAQKSELGHTAVLMCSYSA